MLAAPTRRSTQAAAAKESGFGVADWTALGTSARVVVTDPAGLAVARSVVRSGTLAHGERGSADLRAGQHRLDHGNDLGGGGTWLAGRHFSARLKFLTSGAGGSIRWAGVLL
jgi:hypothetical protein